MNRSKFMHDLMLATALALFVGVAQGGTSDPENFTYNLFEELAGADFQSEGTDDNGKHFNDFTHAKQDEAEYFFDELIEKLISGDHYDDPGMIFWGDVTIRTDLTWQHVKNIIKILKHPQAIQDIIEILKGAQDLDKAKIILQNEKIPSLKTQKKYPITLFLKSLKTVFEKDFATAKKDPSYKATNYVPATLLSNLLSNLDTNVQLLKKAKVAKKTAEEELQILENAIKKTQKAKTNAEDSLKAAEASNDFKAINQHLASLQQAVEAAKALVEQAEKNLAAAQAGTTPPAVANTPLDQLKNSLMALKTKLVNLAQALNHLQNPGAPQPAAPIVASNQSVADAKATLQAAENAHTAAIEHLVKAQAAAAVHQTSVTIASAKAKIELAESTLEKENNKLPAAQQKVTEAIQHLKETIQLVAEIEFTTPKPTPAPTPQPAPAPENPKIEFPKPEPTKPLQHLTRTRPKKPGKKISHQQHAERIKEQKEKITHHAKQLVDEINKQYQTLQAKNSTAPETQEIEKILESAQEKLTTLESNDELETKKSFAREINKLLTKSTEIVLLLQADKKTKKKIAKIQDHLYKQGKSMPLQDLIKINEALRKSLSENAETKEQAHAEIEEVLKKYEQTP